MDVTFNKKKASSINKIEDVLLQVDDLTTIVTFFRRREENIIQLLDLKLKSQDPQIQEETSHIKNIHTQMKEIEEARIEKEDQILSKYSNYKVSDEKQKR